MLKNVRLLFCSLLCFGCATSKRIIDKPIIFNEERMHLTSEYLLNRYGIEKEKPTIEPKMIVLHWTAIPTLQDSFEAFENPTLPNWRPDIENVSGLNVSTHFLVDRDGTIYRLMPENIMGRHVIGLNHVAIGVENVGGAENTPLTDAQLKANIYLVSYLAKKYDIEYLIGHHEYTLFENHPFWLEKDQNYRTKKSDPGPEFMNEVRKETQQFNFKPLPNKS